MKVGLAESPPHPKPSLRSGFDLSPQAGRGEENYATARPPCGLNKRPFSVTRTTASEASVQRKKPVANGTSVPLKSWPIVEPMPMPSRVVIEPYSDDAV